MCFIFATRNQQKYISDDDDCSLLSEVSHKAESAVESEDYDVVCENMIEADSAMDDDLLGFVIELEELELLEQHEKERFQMI